MNKSWKRVGFEMLLVVVVVLVGSCFLSKKVMEKGIENLFCCLKPTEGDP